jgi:hypothetical protein
MAASDRIWETLEFIGLGAEGQEAGWRRGTWSQALLVIVLVVVLVLDWSVFEHEEEEEDEYETSGASTNPFRLGNLQHRQARDSRQFG